LKPYLDGKAILPERIPTHPRPPPALQDNVDGEPEWEVQHILEKKGKDASTRYLVQWRGYPIEEATWEPIEHLYKSLDIVEAFEKRVRKDRRTKAKGDTFLLSHGEVLKTPLRREKAKQA